MNRKQLTLLLGLVAVVGIAGLLVYTKQNQARKEGDPTSGRKLLPNLPVNDVTAIVISQGTNQLHLVKKDELWRVTERNHYPANYSQISDFLLKARDQKVVQTEQAGPSQLPRLELVPGNGTNAAVAVEVKGQNDKLIASLLLGKKHLKKSNRPSPFGDDMGDSGWPDGRFVKTGSDNGTVSLISESFANVEPKPDQWLNKDFVKVEKARSLAVASTQPTNSWTLARETENGEWKLAEAKPAEQLDTSKISALSNPLSSPTFNDVDTVSKPEQLGLDKPTVVTIETFDDFTYTFKVGAKTNDAYPVTVSVGAQLAKERAPGKDEKREDKTKLDKEFKDKQQKLQEKLDAEKAYEGWTYLVPAWTLEQVLRERHQLLQEPKKEEGATNAPPAAAESPLKPLEVK